MIKVDKNIPLPKGAGTGGRKLSAPEVVAFAAMEGGDSFVVPAELARRVRTNIQQHCRRDKSRGYHYASAAESAPGGRQMVRVWKTEPKKEN